MLQETLGWSCNVMYVLDGPNGPYNLGLPSKSWIVLLVSLIIKNVNPTQRAKWRPLAGQDTCPKGGSGQRFQT